MNLLGKFLIKTIGYLPTVVAPGILLAAPSAAPPTAPAAPTAYPPTALVAPTPTPTTDEAPV